jgi:uncharacterized protein YqhQ
VNPQNSPAASRPLVLGGMALVDGVYIRSINAWAIARADGTIESGEIKRSPVAKIPILRVAWSIGQGLMSGLLRKRANAANKRFLITLVALSALGYFEGRLFARAPEWVAAWGLMICGLLLMRVFMPLRLWRYHGAEHKAIASYEQYGRATTAAEAKPVSRIHDRCGTNAVFLVMLLAPLVAAHGLLLPGVLMSAELIRFAVVRFPRSKATRVLVIGGRFLQRTVTTSEPTLDELAVGCRAVEACIARQRAIDALASLSS